MDQAWLLRTSDPARAIALAEPYADADDPKLAAKAGAIVGYARLRLGDLEGSEAALSVAEWRADGLGDAQADGRVQIGLGALRMAQAQYVDAAACFRRAEEAFDRGGDQTGVAGAIVNLALVHRHLGDLPRALELLLEGARRFREVGDRHGEAVALVNTAQVHRDLGDVGSARVRAERAWSIARDLGARPFLVYARTAYGSALAEAGERSEGRAELELAVTEARELGSPALTAEALGSLARVVGEEDPALARALTREALPILQKAGRSWTLAMAWITLGDFAEGPEDACLAYVQAAELADEHGEQGLSQTAHRGAAEGFEALGDASQALAHWRAAAKAGDLLAEGRRAHRLALVEVSLAVESLRQDSRNQQIRIAELMAVGRARSELVGVLAHELRNPLSTAQLVGDLLKEAPETAAGSHLDLLIASHDRMARILDAVTADATSIRSQPVLEWEKTGLLRLVEAIIAEHRGIAQQKGQRLVLEGREVVVEVDSGRIFHAVANLLTNAMKFSPAGCRIVARVSRRGGNARVQIDDEGPGVSPEDAPGLFEPFAKGAATPTGGERSTGLGLHIARRVVEAHGGTIGVEPRSDRSGASFYFELPIEA